MKTYHEPKVVLKVIGDRYGVQFPIQHSSYKNAIEIRRIASVMLIFHTSLPIRAIAEEVGYKRLKSVTEAKTWYNLEVPYDNRIKSELNKIDSIIRKIEPQEYEIPKL